MASIARRDFLKAAAAAYFAAVQTKTPVGPSGPRITDAAYTPIRDYPIQPKRYSDVTITDDFWKPKIAINADVTIPFEVQKLSELERDFGGMEQGRRQEKNQRKAEYESSLWDRGEHGSLRQGAARKVSR